MIKGETAMKSSDLHIPRWVATAVVGVALVGGGVLAIGLKNWSGHDSVFGAGNLLGISVARDSAPVPLGNFANGFASVLKPVLPAVVNIHTSKTVKTENGAGQMPFFNDPYFQQFFGNPGQGDGQNQGQRQFNPRRQPPTEKEQSLGSGVIVTADGTILTNNHVIDGATDIEVDLSDKREFKAKLIGTDAKTDIAVLKIDATNLPTVTFGDSSKLQVGDVVLAIGDPFGVGETATMGIVSAKSRSLNHEVEEYEDFIQTDASINPGNSGGAMIDLHGDLVGINTAIETGGSQGNVGIGFAIPIDMARSIMDQISAHGKVTRGYLGVLIQDVNTPIAKQFGLSDDHGVLLGDITADAPGARAGLKRGDIVLKLNGESVDDANSLRNRISQMAPGTPVRLEIWRDGKAQETTVTLGELPETASAKSDNSTQGENSTGALAGVQVQELSSELSQQLKLPSTVHGVVITSVDDSSPAAEAGLDQGMVIQEVNHKPVANLQQYRQALASAGDQPVLLLVNHGGGTSFIVVQPH
jgi:serine protease Do